jgi:hypothetical protein
MRSSLIVSFLAFTLAACGDKAAPAPTPTEPPAATPTAPAATPAEPAPAAQVCCESFGYGAQMVKCCETYAWTAADACVVAPGMVGGGKDVVDDSKCPAK